MLKNGVHTARFLKHVCPFFNIIDERVNYSLKITIPYNLIGNASQLFNDGSPYYIKNSLLIYRASQWTGFYMTGIFLMRELKDLRGVTPLLFLWLFLFISLECNCPDGNFCDVITGRCCNNFLDKNCSFCPPGHVIENGECVQCDRCVQYTLNRVNVFLYNVSQIEKKIIPVGGLNNASLVEINKTLLR